MKTTSLILALVLVFAGGVAAQSNDEGKIIVEITKEVNGEKKTFKGEYNSTEEMHADPNYQEFSGNTEGFNFWFDNEGDEDVFLHLDQFKNRSGSFFKFFDDAESEDESGHFFFKGFGGDSIDGFFNLHLDDMDIDQYKEHMKNLGMEIDDLLERLHDNGDQNVTILIDKRVKISDVGDEFGKKGTVDDNYKLELEELNFHPNPSSNGRFKVRFKVPEEGDLHIKVSNLEGKEIFSRYFESFNGLYSEMIDLSGQKDGIYLLEIGQGKKRVTKKIVIN